MSGFRPVPQETERAARAAVDAAYKVHHALGPGLLESVYEACFAYELRQRGLDVRTQVALPVVYEQVRVEAGLRLDLLVEHRLIIEVKAVEAVHPVHEAQLLTYLKLTGHRLGLLINFNVPFIKQGIKRIIL